MLKDRILSTLTFFDLQDYTLTLLELEKYLLTDMEIMRQRLDSQWELKADIGNGDIGKLIGPDEILKCLDTECVREVESFEGFYFLKGKKQLAEKRLAGYVYGIQREKRIRRYIKDLRFVPFVRGVGLSGSQAFGQQKEASDIDLFIITDPQFLWLARTLVTAYFQLLGKRRHGGYIQNRFCLNHYVSAPKEVSDYKNLYTALEYLKLRPLVYGSSVQRFVYNNKAWISCFFPNTQFVKPEMEMQSGVQKVFEVLFRNGFGRWLEVQLKNWQKPKIRAEEKFIVVKDDELSFHPDSKQQGLLQTFFTLTQINTDLDSGYLSEALQIPE